MKYLVLTGMLIGFVLGSYVQYAYPSTWGWLSLQYGAYQSRDRCPPNYTCVAK